MCSGSHLFNLRPLWGRASFTCYGFGALKLQESSQPYFHKSDEFLRYLSCLTQKRASRNSQAQAQGLRSLLRSLRLLVSLKPEAFTVGLGGLKMEPWSSFKDGTCLLLNGDLEPLNECNHQWAGTRNCRLLRRANGDLKLSKAPQDKSFAGEFGKP